MLHSRPAVPIIFGNHPALLSSMGSGTGLLAMHRNQWIPTIPISESRMFEHVRLGPRILANAPWREIQLSKFGGLLSQRSLPPPI